MSISFDVWQHWQYKPKKSGVDRKQAQATLANEIRHDSAQLATLAN